ncbi:MAG: hypothetical protein Q4G59_08480, partial [Planctomycetia bacterium]|nr:hypothetical protein [Planctomycetia bacterium]
MSTSRRRFLQSSALAAAALSAPALNAAEKAAAAPVSQDEDPRMRYFDAYYYKEPSSFRFEQPFDGGILQEGTGYPILGTETGPDGVKRLKVHMVVKCSAVSNFQLLGPDGKAIPGDFLHGSFMTTVLVKDRITVFKARGMRKGKPVEISCRVIWAKNAYKRYRCYIDDHSFCFRDILQKEYKSIFDCFYFAKLRELNRMYKTKIVLNCFNSTPERDFTLSMFPDKYKHEFEDNAEWLRLAFHSENEFPGEPYRNAPPEKLAADFDLTATQLKRIAGKAYTAGLQIHFAMVRADSYQVLADRGVKMLPTSGRKNPGTGDKYCDFMLPNNITAYIRENAGWMDPKSGIIFYNGSLPSTCEWTPVSQIEQLQHSKLDNPKQ